METRIDVKSIESVRGWMANWMAQELRLHIREIDSSKAFLGYGMDSVSAMMLVGDLENSLGIRLSPTLAWDYPTIDALAKHLVASSSILPANAPSSNGSPQNRAVTTGHPDAETILSQLDHLTEAEMDSLLRHYLKESR